MLAGSPMDLGLAMFSVPTSITGQFFETVRRQPTWTRNNASLIGANRFPTNIANSMTYYAITFNGAKPKNVTKSDLLSTSGR